MGGINLTRPYTAEFAQQPTLLRDTLSTLSFNVSPYLANIVYFSSSYSKAFKKTGLWGVSLQGINYGNFNGFNATGQSTGSFKAQDMTFVLSKSFVHKVFHYGLNLKWAYSYIQNFAHSSLFADLGAAFVHPKKDFSISVLLKNLNFRAEAPTDLQLGIDFKPNYMPFRFILTLHHLLQFETVAPNPNKAYLDLNATLVEEEISLGRQILRHIILASELKLSKTLQVRLAYNFMHAFDLQTQILNTPSGLSLGVGITKEKWSFAYASSFSSVYNAHHLSLNIRLSGKKRIQKKVVE